MSQLWTFNPIILQGNTVGPTGGMDAWFGASGPSGPSIGSETIAEISWPCDNVGCSHPLAVAYPNFLGTNRSNDCCCNEATLSATPIAISVYRKYEYVGGEFFTIEEGDGAGTQGTGVSVVGTYSDSSGYSDPEGYMASAGLNDCVTLSFSDSNFYPSTYPTADWNVSGAFARTCNSVNWSFTATSKTGSPTVRVSVRVSANWSHDIGDCGA